MKHLLNPEELRDTCLRLRRRRLRIVFANGCFDLLHPGHMRLLSKAANLGDVLVVAINADESVRRLKGPDRPIYSSDERAELLLGIRWVDYVTVFPEDTPLETIHRVRPDVLVKGAEYGEKNIVGAEFVRSLGGRVTRIPMKRGQSTRLILDRMVGTA